jgi:DNA-binding transcriptional regulator YdaS (Cro superfamily)
MRPFRQAHFQPITIEADAPESALAEAARLAVTASLKAEFRPDPLFRPEISQLFSVCTSGAIRHGPLIERAIAGALERNELIVLRNRHVPVTHGALALVSSTNYEQIADQQIDFDGNDIVDYVDADIIAIDEKRKCAGAFSVKRGGGAAGTRKRTSDDRLLRALGFTLASWLRREGHRMVDSALVMVIDYYGQSGFPKDLTIDRNELDDFFGLPITAEVDAMTEAMRAAIDAEIRRLLEPILRTMTPPPAEKLKAAPRPTNKARLVPPRRTRPRWGGKPLAPVEIAAPARTFIAGDRRS